MIHEAQIAYRSDLYASSARQAFERANMRAHGVPELPAQPGDGSSECGTRDKCHWEYEEVEGGLNCTWVLDPAAEHCETCLQRSEEWNPLFVPVGMGEARGWWGPPQGTHGPGSQGGKADTTRSGTLAKGDDTELYRWGNLEDVHAGFLGKRTRSLDVTDRPEWYFAPTKVQTSTSWVHNVYGRYVLDRGALKKAGWAKDENLKTEGAWRWKPANLGKRGYEMTDKEVGQAFNSAIRGYEVVRMPKGVDTAQLGDWFSYRLGRSIPVLNTNAAVITDQFSKVGESD